MTAPVDTTTNEPNGFWEFLFRHRVVWLAVAAAATLLSWPASQSLTLDESIESLYSQDNPRLREFQRSRAIFGGDEFVIFAYRDEKLFDADGSLNRASADKVLATAEAIGKIPGVAEGSVQHIVDAVSVPFFSTRMRRFSEGLLINEPGTVTAVVSKLTPKAESDPAARTETFRQFRELSQTHNPPAVVVGEPIQVHDMFRFVESDGETLGWTSSLLLIAVIFLMFRSARWVIIPLAVVHATLIWTRGLLALSGVPLSMVSSIMTSLVMIVGIATVMHITLRYRDQRASKSALPALIGAVRELAIPIFWTTATTAAGFGVLVTSAIAPVASFGGMMAVATMMVIVAVVALTPALGLFGRTERRPGQAPGEASVAALLAWLTGRVARYPRSVGLVFAGMTLFCGAGLFLLKVETDFSKNFRSDSVVVKSLDFFETELGGAGTWEVNFPAPEKLTNDYVDRVRRITAKLHELEAIPGAGRLTKVVSLSDAVDILPKQLWLSARLALLSARQPHFVNSLYIPEQQRMRILLRANERQPSEAKLQLIAAVERVAREEFPDAEATGLFVLLAYLIESLMSDQWTSFFLGGLAIFFLMAIAFRSLTIGLISLAPNVFPIALVIGMMGWIGLPINIATAMIASVSMGLTVDSSIHYLWAYRAAQARGASFAEAIHEAHQGVGLVLIFANVALVGGFFVLMLSHFIPLVYFGMLVSLAMLGGLIGNLVLLPLLLRAIEGASAER